MKLLLFLAALAVCGCRSPAFADSTSLTPPQLFEVAREKSVEQRFDEAITIYSALERDPHSDIRWEALYRHGKLLENQKHLTESAVLFRTILDENPHAQRVRLELAKVLADMGHENAARRELRQAQAGNLPPEVAQIVNQYAVALRSAKPLGGTFEVGIAPSNNINRATSSPTLNSILGPLVLSGNAQAKSGIGLNLGGQGNAQLPLSSKIKLSAQLSNQNALFRDAEFDDSIIAGSVGVSMLVGSSLRLKLDEGPSYRIYGGHPYSTALNGTVDVQYPLDKRSQIGLQSDFSVIKYIQNPLQNGDVFGETLSYDRALNARFGSKLSLFAQRATANDPGYATKSAGASVLVWHELGKTTLYATGSISHLLSDARLFLYTDRRNETLYRAGLGATFRQIIIDGFSPVLRMNYESNRSTIDTYNYRRFGGEVAITRAF